MLLLQTSVGAWRARIRVAGHPARSAHFFEHDDPASRVSNRIHQPGRTYIRHWYSTGTKIIIIISLI